MSDAEFKDNLYKFGGINAAKGTIYLRGNMRMLGNGSYMSQLTVKDMVVTGNAVIPGISFDSLTVAGNVVSTDGNFIGNGALMSGVISTPPPEANIDISGNVVGTYANVDRITAIAGNIGNVRLVGGNVSASGQVNVRGNAVAGYFIGNGARVDNVRVSGTQIIDIIGNVRGENADVGDITATTGTVGGVLMTDGNVTTSGQVDVLGNVVAGYIIGNGALLTGILTKLPSIANVDIRGDVTGGYVNVDQIIANVGNIGNVLMSGGDIFLSGNVHAIGSVTAGYFIGNGSLLTNVNLPITDETDIRGNVIGTYANMDEVIATFGNIGNVKIGNTGMQLSGQVNVLGNMAAGYFIGNGALLTGVTLDGTQSIDIRGNVDGAYANADTVRATYGNIDNVIITSGNVGIGGQLFVVGNVTAGYFIGNGVLLTNVGLPPIANIDISGNVTGEYANVGQITAIAGNVGSVRIENGDVIVSGQVNVRENVVAGYIIGNGALLNAIDVFGNASIGGSIVAGNVAARGFIGNGSRLYDVVATRIPPIANLDIRGNVTGEYANVGDITATAGNVGNVRMENGAMIAGGQVNVVGNVISEYFTGNGVFLTNIHASGVQNIDILGNVDGAYANVGDITATAGNVGNVNMSGGNIFVSGNANVTGNVTAGYFIGNGALLTGVSVQRRYLTARRNGNQTTPGSWKNVTIVMNEVVKNNNIPYNPVTGVFTLQAGVTYSITAQLAWQSGVSKYYQFRLINTVTKSHIGVAAEVYPPGSSTKNTSAAVLDVIYTPDTDIQCSLQISDTNADKNQEVRADLGTFLNIVETNNGVVSTGLPPIANATIQGNLVGTSVNMGNLVASTFGNIGSVIMEKGNVTAGGQVNTIGNVTANCFIGNGAQLRNVVAIGTHSINIRGNVDMGNINVHVIYASLEGNVGNVRMKDGNVTTRGQVNVLGNVIAGRFIGDGSLLTNVTPVGNANIDIIGNVGAGTRINVTTITVTTFANIANVRMEKGNVTAGGKVSIFGDVTANCFIGNGALITRVKVSGIQMIDIQGNVEGSNVNVGNMKAIVGDIGGVRMENGCIIAITGNVGNVRIENGNLRATGQVDVVGNVSAGRFFGDGSKLTNMVLGSIQRMNITGNVGNGNFIDVSNVKAVGIGNIANVILRGGNITANSGNIAGIQLGNNANVGQVDVRGNVTANCFIGNGMQLTNVILTGNQVIDIEGNVIRGIYVNVSTVIASQFGNIANVRMENGNVTANIGNIGNVRLEAGNITALAGNIGDVRMQNGDVSTSGQVNVLGNVVANVLFGDGSTLTSVTSTYALPPETDIDVNGNLIGRYLNVHIIQAITGNIGNTRLAGGNVSVSGQVNVRGNVVGNVYIGNIISIFGNIGNTRMIGGNAIVSGQVNVLGNVVATKFSGNGLMISNVAANLAWLSLTLTGSKTVPQGTTWANRPISNGLSTLTVRDIAYDAPTGNISLTPGIPYRITAQFGFQCDTTIHDISLIKFGLYSHSESTFVGSLFARPQVMSGSIPLGPGTTFATSCPLLDVIVIPPKPSGGGPAKYDVRFATDATAGYLQRITSNGSFINVVALTNGPAIP
jgi:hypothetical protein